MLAPYTYGGSKAAHNLADMLNKLGDTSVTRRIGVQWLCIMRLIRALDKIDRKSPLFNYTYNHIKLDIKILHLGKLWDDVPMPITFHLQNVLIGRLKDIKRNKTK